MAYPANDNQPQSWQSGDDFPPPGSPGLPLPKKPAVPGQADQPTMYPGGSPTFDEKDPSGNGPYATTSNDPGAPPTPPASTPTDTPAPASSGQAQTQPTGKDLETRWVNFTNQLSGYTGPGGAFDASQGRTGASAAAGSARGNLQGTVDAYNKQFGANAKVVNGDRIDFTGQGGEGVDVIRDAGGGQSGFWFGGDTGGGGGAGAGGAPPSSPGPAGSPGGGPIPISSGPTEIPKAPTTALGEWTGTTPGQGSALYDTLMKRAGQSLNIDPNDPIIRNQADAHSAQLEREKTKYLQGVAERAGSNANISDESRAASEKVGQGSADFESALMGREVDARRQEIQQALSGAQGLLTNEQQLQLQGELAKLNEAGTNYRFGAGLGEQSSEFTRQLAQREAEFGRNLTATERALLQRESEFSRGLGQQQSEFDRNLANSAYQFDANDRFRNSPLYG